MAKHRLQVWRRIVIVVAALIVSEVSVSYADYYKYTDANGSVCITNKLENVPPKYRKGMRVITERSLADKDKLLQQPAGTRSAQENPQPAPEPSTAPAQQNAATAEGKKWPKLVAFLAASAVGLFVIAKVAGNLPSPMLARLIYLVFFFGVFLFAYKSYADYMVESYFSVKERVLGMFKKSNARESAAVEEGQKTREEIKP